MRAKDKDRAKALGYLILEDLASAAGLQAKDMDPKWGEFAEAMALFAFAQGELERAASLGCVFYTAARLP